MSYDRSKSGLTALSPKTRPNKELVQVFEGSFSDVIPELTRVLDFGAGNGRHSNTCTSSLFGRVFGDNAVSPDFDRS